MTVAPHSPYTVGEETLLKVDALVKKYDARIHIHLHETEAECNDSEQLNRASMCCHKSDQKLHPLANFKRLGLLSERLVCAHMTHLTDEEIDDVAHAGAHVVHCPSSNLKLASGIARVTEMLRRGVNVTLGTDGAASNNSLDMLAEMKPAALLAKAESCQSTTCSVSAAEALQMATLNSARALGLDQEIGSIEVGKRADIIAIECDSIEMLPMYNAVSHVVYAAGRKHVSDVWEASASQSSAYNC